MNRALIANRQALRERTAQAHRVERAAHYASMAAGASAPDYFTWAQGCAALNVAKMRAALGRLRARS